MKPSGGLLPYCWIVLFVTLCLKEAAGTVCSSNCTWNPWQDITQCSQQCGPKGLQVKIRDGVDGDCKCLEEDTYELLPCNRLCLNGGSIETIEDEDVCICQTGFHGECCEHGYDLTVFVVCYIIIIMLCFVFVTSMFCVGEYRHKNVLQAIPTTYETEFDDFEEEEPLLEPKFVWTAPHDSKKMGLFHKSWDSYSEFSSRAGSVMSVGSFTFECVDGAKTFKGHDAVLERLDIFEIAMLRNFGELDRDMRMALVHKIAPRLDFEEQIKLRSFDSLSGEETMEMVSRLLGLADKAAAIKEHEQQELKALEDHPAFDDMDSEVVEMMGRFDELTAEERERVIEQLDGVLTEKEKIKLKNWDQLSKREQDQLLGRLRKLQEVGRKVEAKKRAEAPDDDGLIELVTSSIGEGLVSVPSLRTAIESEAIRNILKMVGMQVGGLCHRPDARLEIRSRVLAKLILMTEEEVMELCRVDGMDQETMDGLSHVERIQYLADRASCACVADVPAIQAEIREEKLRAEEEAKRLREEGAASTISSMSGLGPGGCKLVLPTSPLSGVMSMSSDDDDDDRPARRTRKVDFSKIKWTGPPKGAKPGFNRGGLSLGVLSTSVKKFKEREKAGTIQGRANVRAQALSERLVKTKSMKSQHQDSTMKQSLRKRLSQQAPQGEDDFDTSSIYSKSSR